MSENHTRTEAFRKLRSQTLGTLNLTIEEYEHQSTGARHFHLAADNPENVFLVAFRTVPMDSTGVAHILEHTALCGSRKFPVRDPFFMMNRRSMNTFMNAFTSSDWTAYPFASQNRKDFNNLLEVYLDAAFFSRLHELDFAQEGCRLEFAEPENPDSPLEYRGVVYNEMKGAMSSPNAYIWELLSAQLFPTTTYHYNSGGDPETIPELSYEELKHFYKTHYHPSNAIFMTYGDIPAREHQEKFQELALKHFDKLDINIHVEDEKRYHQPHHIEEYYPLDEAAAENKTHILLSWLLGKSTDQEELYEAQLLSSVLLNNSASPLLHALETSPLGQSPSPLCGLEDSNREMSFICGLEGCANNSSEAVETLILETLQNIVEHGIDQEQVEAVLHSLELSQREISGDSYPYGLQLILSSLSAAIHRGDPIELLDIDPVLAKLKQAVKDPAYIPGLIRKYLLNNQHRVLLTVRPDPELSALKAENERLRLADIKTALSEQETRQILERSKALASRQAQQDDISVLPKVEPSDVPAEVKRPKARESRFGKQKHKLSFYGQGTNGISYQQVIMPVPQLEPELLDVLPYYSSCIPEMGVGERDYLEIQRLQSSISGGINAFVTMRPQLDDVQNPMAFFALSSKALYPNQEKLNRLLFDTLTQCRFDEKQRIKEIIEQISSRKSQSITSQGHSLAMGLACSGMSPISAVSFRSSGLQGIKRLQELCNDFNNEDQLQAFSDKFANLHQRLLEAPKQFLAIAELSQQESLQQVLEQNWGQFLDQTGAKVSSLQLPPLRQQIREAWTTSTQVNFCAKAYPTVTAAHQDAAALTVLGGFMRNGFLHRAVREQGGAYGGGASQDNLSAAFRFYSYRDPRMEETLDDFDAAINWLLSNKHDDSQLEEAILGVISSMDKPASPAGEAKQAFYNELFGRSPEHDKLFREQVLNVTIDSLRKMAEKYFNPEQASIGIVTNKAGGDRAAAMGLGIKNL